MDNKQPEKLIRLADVSKLDWLPERAGGQKWHLSSIYAWAKTGRRGVKLRTTWCGGLCTTASWLMEFFDAMAGNASDKEAPRSQSDREKAIDRAERELEASGI